MLRVLLFGLLPLVGADVAIGGFDMVEYFNLPDESYNGVNGTKEHSLTHRGIDWWFKDDKNMATFKANPDKYAPQYGGWWAWAVAREGSFFSTIDPAAWTIHNGLLYLNWATGVRRNWERGMDQYIPESDKRWKQAYGSLNVGPVNNGWHNCSIIPCP